MSKRVSSVKMLMDLRTSLFCELMLLDELNKAFTFETVETLTNLYLFRCLPLDGKTLALIVHPKCFVSAVCQSSLIHGLCSRPSFITAAGDLCALINA